MNENYDSVSNCIHVTKYRGWGEVNGHVLWEKLKIPKSEKWYLGGNKIPCIIVHSIIVWLIAVLWG